MAGGAQCSRPEEEVGLGHVGHHELPICTEERRGIWGAGAWGTPAAPAGYSDNYQQGDDNTARPRRVVGT